MAQNKFGERHQIQTLPNAGMQRSEYPKMTYPFDRSGTYAICVVGVLDKSWTDRLGGMTVSEPEVTPENSSPVARLVGWVPDQAALAGILNTLYENHFALLCVQYLGASQSCIPSGKT